MLCTELSECKAALYAIKSAWDLHLVNCDTDFEIEFAENYWCGWNRRVGFHRRSIHDALCRVLLFTVAYNRN